MASIITQIEYIRNEIDDAKRWPDTRDVRELIGVLESILATLENARSVFDAKANH